MIFGDIETIASIVFILLLTLFIFLKRKQMQTQKLLFPLLYFSIYRTKLGLRFMDSFAGRFRRLLIFAGYFGIILGFLGMMLISYFLVNSLVPLFTDPDAKASITPVLPFKARGIFFVPFFYWIISIFVIALVHEMAHGIIARAYDLKVKSSGFAFLGVLLPVVPAAFVEPDEKKMRKRPWKEQVSIFAAGPFSNFIFGFLFIALAYFFLSPVAGGIMEPDGIKVTGYVDPGKELPAEKAGLEGQTITAVDNNEVKTIDDLAEKLGSKRPGQVAAIKTDKDTYRVNLAKNPGNESKAYIGAYLEQSSNVKENIKAGYGESLPRAIVWITGNPYASEYISGSGLIGFLILLNFGVGLFNLVPIGPLDGGRMLQAVLLRFFEKKRANKIFGGVGLFFLSVVIVHIVFAFIKPA